MNAPQNTRPACRSSYDPAYGYRCGDPRKGQPAGCPTPEPVPTCQPASGSDYLDNLAAIESTEPTEDQQRKLSAAVDRMPYMAVVLAGLAAHLTALDDHEGATLLLSAAADMAQHEARTI